VSSAATASRDAEDHLDAYAAQAAHQLGEAVALLRGYTVALEQRGDHDPDVTEALRGLAAGTQRAQRFVDDLLDLAATSSAEPAAEPVALREALDAAAHRLADDLEDTGARVRAGALPVANADRDLVVRLLVHLLRDALAAGARIVRVRSARRDGKISIELHDDGTAPEGDPFRPFARARGRGPLVGAGVGLTVGRRIVERHGGTIAQRPGREGGAVVSFTLPAFE
jgi:signal transduction histidine kinase